MRPWASTTTTREREVSSARSSPKRADLHHRENPPPEVHDSADVRRGLGDPGDFRNPHDLARPRDWNREFLTVEPEDDQMTLGFRFRRPNGDTLLGHVVGEGQQAVTRGELQFLFHVGHDRVAVEASVPRSSANRAFR